MPAAQTNIKVAVRVRPYNRHELEQNQQCIIKVLDDQTLLFDPENEDDEFFYQGTKQNYRDITKRTHKKLSMEFDRVYDTESTNSEIFQECTMPLVDAVLNGYNCSVFVYGATGAGKTFTMLGNASCAGLTFLTMHDLFAKVQEQSHTVKFDVRVSYLEVYNEHVMNLLEKTGPLKLCEDSNGVVVSGLVLKPISSAEALLQMLTLGNSNRTQHPTDANAESSRSHAIFQVHIRMTDRKTGTKRTVKLSMIDLAGSERAASTRGIGLRFKEGASINKSLLALGNCINKLADGLKHIPYRDSNLTRILKDSLGGNCQTLMVANISMSSLTYEDTYNTLKYASRAKKIRTTLRQNVLTTNMPKDFYVKKVIELMAENERIKEANVRFEAATKLAQAQRLAAVTAANSDDSEQLKPWYRKIDAVYASVMKSLEYVLGIQSKIKNLNLNCKHRKQLEQYLPPSNHNSQEALKAAINAQVEAQQAELTHWRKKHQETMRDLPKLRDEIRESAHADTLRLYLHGKDLEIEISKKNFAKSHAMLIHTELIDEAARLRSAFATAYKMLHSLSASFSDEQREQYDKMLNDLSARAGSGSSNAMAFKEPDTKKNRTEDDVVAALPLNGKRLQAAEHMAVKRPRLKATSTPHCDDLALDATDDVDDSNEDEDNALGAAAFKIPSNTGMTSKAKKTTTRVRNLNETHIVLTDCEANTSMDYSMKSTSSSTAAMPKRDLINGILSEQIVHVPSNKDHLKNALLKSKQFSHQGLLKTVAAGVQKENRLKYSPGKVRKSPRSLVTKAAFAGTVNSIRKPNLRNPNAGSGGNAEPPTVRINRAASFRFKK